MDRNGFAVCLFFDGFLEDFKSVREMFGMTSAFVLSFFYSIQFRQIAIYHDLNIACDCDVTLCQIRLIERRICI